MNFTTADIEPTMLANLRAGTFERVVVKTHDHSWLLGRRYDALIRMFNCLGRLTIVDDDTIYHSMAGSVPTYNAAELSEVYRKAQDEVEVLHSLGSLLARNSEVSS